MLEVHNRCKRLRERLGITQKQLADETCVSVHTIHNLEINDFCPRVDDAYMLARYFEVSIEYLCGITDVREVLTGRAGQQKQLLCNQMSALSRDLTAAVNRVENVLREVQGDGKA